MIVFRVVLVAIMNFNAGIAYLLQTRPTEISVHSRRRLEENKKISSEIEAIWGCHKQTFALSRAWLRCEWILMAHRRFEAIQLFGILSLDAAEKSKALRSLLATIKIFLSSFLLLRFSLACMVVLVFASAHCKALEELIIKVRFRFLLHRTAISLSPWIVKPFCKHFFTC